MNFNCIINIELKIISFSPIICLNKHELINIYLCLLKGLSKKQGKLSLERYNLVVMQTSFVRRHNWQQQIFYKSSWRDLNDFIKYFTFLTIKFTFFCLSCVLLRRWIFFCFPSDIFHHFSRSRLLAVQIFIAEMFYVKERNFSEMWNVFMRRGEFWWKARILWMDRSLFARTDLNETEKGGCKKIRIVEISLL